MPASILTPVTVLTGFLGSGKTTLLNRLLRHPACADSAVVINEFGAIPIDHLLVREASENIALLASGCICCSVQGDLVRTLRDLYFKRANGEVPAFRRLVIETTGLADPAPILHTLIEMPVIAARYSLSGVVTTVDAQYGMMQLDEHFESVKQAAVADRIVIAKADLAGSAALAALRRRLAQLNPGARLLDSAHGNVDPGLLFDTGLYHADGKPPDVRAWLNEAAYRPVNAAAGSNIPRHDARIRALALSFDVPAPWQNFLDALDTLIALRGENLLRMKGIVNVAGEARPRVVHAVQHTLYPHAALPEWPDGDRRTRLVFIVRDLDGKIIRDTFSAFMQDDSLAQAK
jgi:G3E family GTPase